MSFRSAGWVALVLLFLASLPAVTTRLYASDEIEYFSYLRSVWFDHDLSFQNEYQYFYDRDIARAQRFHETFLEMTTETGRRFNFATIGPALLWAPMYGVADAGVRLVPAAGSPVEADGFSRPYLAAVTYGSALYGFLAVLLSALVARRMVGHGRAAALIVWLGTPLLFYMYLAPGMSHACSAFAVAAFVAAWLTVRERWSTRGLMGLGALAALMTMVREQDAFFVVGPAVDFAWMLVDEWRAGRRATLVARARNALAGAVTFAVCFLPQAWAYIVLNGRLGPPTLIQAKMQWASPHAWQVLFSPEHGFFFWSPLALLGLVGLVKLSAGWAAGGVPSRVRRLAVCMLLMFAAQVYVSGSVDTWTVAGSFGQRRFVGASVILVAGVAALLRSANGWRRWAVAVVVATAVWWNLGLMAQFGAGLMDRQRLELARNAYTTFVTVPISLPSLAYRYLFDRSSFYRSSEPRP